MQGSKYSPKVSGDSRDLTNKTVKPVKTAAPEKKMPAAEKPEVKRKHVTFQVQTKPGSKVHLAGDFNEWNCLEKELADQDGNGVYNVVLALPPGTYEYKFHINGVWCADPGNPNFKQNSLGTLNSVIIVE